MPGRKAPGGIFIVFEGKEISVLREGRGEDMVFLHGYLSSKECFTFQIKYFSKFYRVTAFDFVGFGKSAPLSEPWSVGDYAAYTARFLDSLGIKNARLIAHSFGGRVAIKLLAEGYPAHSALLTGCAGIPPKRGLSYKCKVRAYRIAKKIAPRFAERRFGSEEYRKLSPMLRESYKKIVNEDLRGDAARITRPVLFVCGSEDKETPLSSQRVYVRAVKGSSLYVMEGCGHFAHLEDALAFNVKTEEFLRWESGRSSPTSRAACLRDTSL